jgi:hypothetical protein
MADDHAVALGAHRPSRGPLIRPERYPFFDKLLFAVFVLGVPVFVASHWTVFRDGDVSWHIAAGRWIVENGRVPSTDPFSFTMAGKQWIAFEWGAEVIYWTAYRVAGFAGLAATVAAALMTLATALFIYLRSKAGPVALLVTFVVTYLVLMPFIMARPHVLGWPFLAAWSALLFHYRDQGRSPPLPLVLLIFFWANIHGSYFAGFIVAAAVALDALNEAGWDRQALVRWITFGIGCLVAAVVNANGMAGLLHPLTISGMETLPGIAEWRPSTTRNTPVFFLASVAVLGLLLFKRPRFRIGELCLLLTTLAMALMHVRHQSVFVIIATLILTPKLAGRGREQASKLFGSTAEARTLIAAAAATATLAIGLRMMIPLSPRETFANPRGLLAHIPPGLRSQPLINEYSFGGPLILAGIRPFIDGRADMYGDQFFADYLKLADGDDQTFNRVVSRYGIRWTMLEPENRLVAKLDASPDWRRLYSDGVGVIHVRRSGGGPEQTPCDKDAKRKDCS